MDLRYVHEGNSQNVLIERVPQYAVYLAESFDTMERLEGPRNYGCGYIVALWLTSSACTTADILHSILTCVLLVMMRLTLLCPVALRLDRLG
jgi:hypothetical protein